jgi:hypothetical protein
MLATYLYFLVAGISLTSDESTSGPSKEDLMLLHV